jgi:hypothetical protein
VCTQRPCGTIHVDAPRSLARAEASSDWAIAAGSSKVNTPGSRSGALPPWVRRRDRRGCSFSATLGLRECAMECGGVKPCCRTTVLRPDSGGFRTISARDPALKVHGLSRPGCSIVASSGTFLPARAAAAICRDCLRCLPQAGFALQMAPQDPTSAMRRLSHATAAPSRGPLALRRACLRCAEAVRTSYASESVRGTTAGAPHRPGRTVPRSHRRARQPASASGGPRRVESCIGRLANDRGAVASMHRRRLSTAPLVPAPGAGDRACVDDGGGAPRQGCAQAAGRAVARSGRRGVWRPGRGTYGRQARKFRRTPEIEGLPARHHAAR